jgi:hypothetical protein
MGFPIALGTKSAASRLIPAAQPLEEFDHRDGGLLLPSSPSRPSIVVATSVDQELLALITLYYYNMCRKDEGTVAYSVAELHIQVSLLAQSTSLSGREVLHRIPLLGNPKEGDVRKDEDDSKYQSATKPMAVFSADRRYLTCLIPHPRSSGRCESSSVIIFQLRRPKAADSNAALHSEGGLPIPAYIVPSLLERPIIPVATNPKMLMSSSSYPDDVVPLTNATSICDVEASVGPLVSGLLLVGCLDGTVQAATYRPATCCGVLHSAISGDDDRNAAVSVVELDHWTEWRDHSERTLVGRLAVLWSNGQVKVFRSHFAETDDAEQQDHSRSERHVSSSIRSSSSTGTREASDFSFGVIPTHEFPNADDNGEVEWGFNRFVSVKWIAGSYLAVLEAPDRQCTVHVVGLYDYGKYTPVSTMIITREQLDESMKDVFCVHSDQRETRDIGHCSHEDVDNGRRTLLEYDAYTDCLTITSFLHENDEDARKYRFVCLWNWRTNVLGLLASLTPGSDHDSRECGTLHFAVDHLKNRKIVLVGASAATPTQPQLHLFKETYDVAILSPPYETTSQRFRLRETNTLLLSNESVSYPHCTKSSPATEHFEVEWMEAAIPKQYLSLFGAPVLGAVGRDLGRTIAVASARGVCVLDRTESDRSNARILDEETGANLSRPPHWRLFANETHERSFRVVAMTWWEVSMVQKADLVAAHVYTDNLLVAVVEVLESHDKSQGYYLSCWSCRDLELSAQLLRLGTTTNGGFKGSRWGIPMPPDFLPGCIDLLVCPFVTPGERIATVLLADSSYSSKYFIFQLQVVTSAPQVKGSSVHAVVCKCIAHGNVGSPSELFLASASFYVASRNGATDKLEDYAVLGVIRKYGGGLDALSVCSSNIVSVGQVIESADQGDNDPPSAEISRYWLSDVVRDEQDLFLWTMQLADGRLLSWSVPFLQSMEKLNLSSKDGLFHCNAASSMVHPKSMVLGFVCPAGTVSNWMQQSSIGAQCDFLCGSIPLSSRGCFLGVSQSVKNIRASLAADVIDRPSTSSVLNHSILRPSDFKLYPPAFLPSFYVLANEADLASVNSSGCTERFARHLQQKMNSRSLQDMSMMSIQLIVLRLVEKLAVVNRSSESKDAQKYTLLRGILIKVVAGIRRQTTALQFASFFLQLGRQVEPSCLPHLFPLPETVEDLVSVAVTSGSVPTAASAIPLLSDQKLSLSMCTSLFHYCITQFDASSGAAGTSFEFVICSAELEATDGLFRYALKGQVRRISFDEDLTDNDAVPVSRYSILCGVTNIFGGRIKPSPHTSVAESTDDSPLLVHGITDDRIKKLKEFGLGHIRRLSSWKYLHPNDQCLGSVPAVAARYVVATLFGGSAFETRVGWNKVAVLATLLMRDVAQQECSSASLSHGMQHTKFNRWVALVPVDIRRGGMTHLLKYCLKQCSLDADLAGRVLDFLLVLLLRCDVRHLGSDRPGLLLASVVAAHFAGRIPDILDRPGNNMDELSAAYFELFPMPSDKVTNDDLMVIV